MRFWNFLIEWDIFSVNLQSNPSLNDLGSRQGADLLLCFFSFHRVLMVIEDEATLFTSLTLAWLSQQNCVFLMSCCPQGQRIMAIQCKLLASSLQMENLWIIKGALNRLLTCNLGTWFRHILFLSQWQSLWESEQTENYINKYGFTFAFNGT